MIVVYKICDECHTEFELSLSYGICNYQNCPHCNHRNDLWIKAIIKEDE